MENSIVSLFDEDDFGAAQPDKKSAAKKKSNKKNIVTSNSMFSFDDPVDDNLMEASESTNERINDVLEEKDSDTTVDDAPLIVENLSENDSVAEITSDTIPEIKPVIEDAAPSQVSEKIDEAKEDNALDILYQEAIMNSGIDYVLDKSQVAKKTIENDVQDEDIHFDIQSETNTIPALPEWNLTKQYYTIGEVAKLFEVNTSHIRFWSKEFKFKLRTNRKGDRYYTTDDINRLRVIYHLVKVKKHTIKGAREKLSTEKKTVIQKLSLKEQLVELQHTLVQFKNNI